MRPEGRLSILRLRLGWSAIEMDRGILICGIGLGMAIVALSPGVRCPGYDDLTAELCRRHNDAMFVFV